MVFLTKQKQEITVYLRPESATLLRGVKLVALMKEVGRDKGARGEAGDPSRCLLSRGIPLLLLKPGLKGALKEEERGSG